MSRYIIIFKVLLGKIPAVIFPPWWAVPVLAVITAIFCSTGNRQNQYRQKMKFREPLKSVPPNCITAEKVPQKNEVPGTTEKVPPYCGTTKKVPPYILQYRQKVPPQ